MKEEYEIRVLEIDIDKIREKLKTLGAQKVGTYFQRRYLYHFKPEVKGKWIRLRTNGEKVTVTVKNRVSEEIGGTLELEFVVEDFDKMHLFMQELGYVAYSYQENKREAYDLNGTQIDIDTWPMIPTFLEIEAQNQKTVLQYIEVLGVKDATLTTDDLETLYQKYGIDLNQYKKLEFKENEHEEI